jgi:excisionase family DNA binding protein
LNFYQQIHDDFRAILRETLKEELAKINFDKTRDTGQIEYGTREEVAKVLRISLPTLNDYTKRGILTAYKIGGKILYRWDDVHAAVQKVEHTKYRRAV